MAITVQTPAVIRPWGGSHSKQYPYGLWTGRIAQNGDATGGLATWEITLKVGNLYSVENVTFDVAGAAFDAHAHIQTSDGGMRFRWSLDVADLVGSEASRLIKPPTMIFNPDAEALVGVLTNNAAALMQSNFWGWVWDRDAIRTGVGPLRPGEGIEGLVEAILGPGAGRPTLMPGWA